MASSLDLQEQEQLDELKAFWSRYGNLVTSLLVLGLLAYAGWTGWQYWQREQGAKAGALYDELDRAARTGDAAVTARILADLQERYPRTTFASQGALLAAKVAADKGQADAATADLDWIVERAGDAAYRDIARLRLSGLLLDANKPEEAMRRLDGIEAASEFAPLAADRRGDILAAQGKRVEAVAAWKQAWDKLDDKGDYRRVVEAKLDAAGASPNAPAAAAALAGTAAATTATSAGASSAAATSPATTRPAAPAAAASPVSP